MKSWGLILFSVIGLNSLIAQTDTLNRREVKPAVMKVETLKQEPKIVVRSDIRHIIFGNYQITNYAILSKHTPSKGELTEMVGTLVKVDSTTITGTAINPYTFNIYLVERLKRDDFIYRVFGREIKAPEPDLPDSFNVHKTDNENLYGIVEIDATKIAIPYNGVLLFLTRK